MKLPVLLFALAAIVLTVLAPHYALAHTHRPRDAIAYYLREYNEKGQLVRAVKMYRGEVFFEYNYSYHENDMIKTARVARGGRDRLLQWDERGQPPEVQHNAL